jgi:glutamine cyclotransferase
MSDQVKRYKMDDKLILTYKGEGWALIGNDEELIGSDKMHANLKVPYKNGQTMLEFIEEVIAKDLGTPAN